MPSRGSIVVTGWQADMIDSGTMIVRDQALTRYRLTGNQRGSSSDLGRHGRALLVGNLAQQRQVEAREAVDRVGAAVGQDRRAGPLHRLASSGRGR